MMYDELDENNPSQYFDATFNCGQFLFNKRFMGTLTILNLVGIEIGFTYISNAYRCFHSM